MISKFLQYENRHNMKALVMMVCIERQKF
uniref:Uncharacterized protein n=1 Tax=Rhizophora mucronata TaxID=61149 RepID=A0A2P2QFJ2_RHIMU